MTEDDQMKAFQEDFGVTPQTSEPKGKGYIELLVDNIVGLDNDYESFGEAFGKSFNEDELDTLKNMALSAYEGAKEFVTSPIETTKDIAIEISDSVSRLGAESLDGRIKRMYGVGYQDATEEQVSKAREAVIGDAITASSLVPAAKGVTTVAKAAIPGKVQADVVGQMRSLLDGDREFRTESKNPPVGLSAQATGAGPAASKKTVPFFRKKGAAPNMPDAAFGIKKVSDIFEEDQWDMLKEDPESPWSLVPDGETWDLSDGYDPEKLGYARNVTIDDLAKIRLGKVDVESLLDDWYGTDPTPEAVEYINSRLNRLSNNPDFVDYLNKRGENPDFDPYAAMGSQESSDKIIFKSPIPEALNSMGWPNKGKEGYQILSELRNNPSIRKSELDTVVSDIDPKKRYTLEEAQELVSGNLWNTEVRVLSGNRGEARFETYQRQVDLQDPEKEYFELVIDSRREGDKPTFLAAGQHFDPSTLAHARASVRVDDRGEYILPEEFQADLLQKGYAEPRSRSTQTSPADVIERKKDKLTSYNEDELDLLKILGEDRHSTFFNYDSYKNFIEKVGPENLAPGKTQEEILEMLGPTSRTFSSDDLLGLYANFKAGKNIGSVTPNSPEAWDYWDNLKDTYFNVVDTDISVTEDPGVSAPPIKKIEESVKMTLGALIAEADKRGIDRIIIPPFERIVARRFTPGTEDYKKALDPKSGFYKTYVKSTQAAIKDLEEEFGIENVSSRPVDLNYKTSSLSGIEDSLGRRFGYSPDNGWEGYLDSRGFHEDLRAYFNYAADDDSLPYSGLQPREFTEILRNLRIKGLKNADIEDFNYGEFRPLSEFMREKLGEDLVVTGTEIDFRGLRGSEYDLRRLRFAEGGMVEDKQMTRLMAEGGMADDGMTREPVTGNEVPPGSLAKEVRDDVPAQLSEGEYVIPADVVRFFGVRFFEDLRMQAKQGLSEMDREGRIGGVPVDDQGIPVEGDDELTPEEEQMLMEALGNTGMAEGGLTDTAPAFDRSGFTIDPANSGIQSRKYFNSTTGETRTFQFMNGIPLGNIPEGFAPWTQEAEAAYNKSKQEQAAPVATTPVAVSDGGGGGGPTPGGDGEGRSYDKWAKENYDALSSNAYQFGLDALSDTSGQMGSKIAGGVGLLAGGPLGAALMGIGAGVKSFNKIENIAAARAALDVMEAKGLTDSAEYKDLDSKVNKAIDELPGLQGFLVGKELAASGKGYMKAYQREEEARKAQTPTAAPTTGITSGGTKGGGTIKSPVTTSTTGSSDRRDTGTSTPSAASGSAGTKLGFGSATGGKTTSTSVTGGTKTSFGSATGGKSATTTSTKASDFSLGKPAPTNVGKGSTSSLNKDYGTVGSTRGGRAKGGLVEKPKKGVAKKK